MSLFDAFKALEEVADVEVEVKPSKKKIIKESVNEKSKSKVMTIDISGKDMYDKGQAYYYAHTGDSVDYRGAKFTIITDKDGGHRIGYSDTLLLKNQATGEEIEVSKKDFIKDATLLKEEINESRKDYWVLSDGKNPYRSHVYAQINDLDDFISKLESHKEGQGYWELLHYVDGKDTKVWDTESGKIGESCENCKESCELKEEPKYDLGTQHDSRKSFYGKAKVDVKPNGSQVLYSYGTPVCRIEDGKVTLLSKGYLGWASSQTTLRHVKEFLKQNGFKADSLKQISKDYPKEQARSDESLEESLNESVLKESEAVSLNDEDAVKKAKEILNKEEEETPEQIVDVDANTVDKLKDSYIGNVVLLCPVCKTPRYIKPELLKKDEETGMFNVGEECTHCGSTDGFEAVGQIAKPDIAVEEPIPTTGTDVSITDVEPSDEEPTENDLKEIEKGNEDVGEVASGKEDVDSEGHAVPTRKLNAIKAESLETKLVEDLDEVKFDKLVNQYLVNVYDNVDAFKTTSGKIVEDLGDIIIEGNVTFKSGKVMPIKFTFSEGVVTKGGKYKLVGLCEQLTDKENAFTLVGSLDNSNYIPETLAYEYSTKVLVEGAEEAKTIRGRVNLRKSK